MTNNLNNEEYIHILNGYSFEYRASGKKPYLIALGFYNSRDKRLYESDDLTIFFCLAFFVKRQEKLLPKISEDWWQEIEHHYSLPIFSKTFRKPINSRHLLRKLKSRIKTRAGSLQSSICSQPRELTSKWTFAMS